jgi:hypothetical protein
LRHDVTRNKSGVARENGAIESGHGRLKKLLGCAGLMPAHSFPSQRRFEKMHPRGRLAGAALVGEGRFQSDRKRP